MVFLFWTLTLAYSYPLTTPTKNFSLFFSFLFYSVWLFLSIEKRLWEVNIRSKWVHSKTSKNIYTLRSASLKKIYAHRQQWRRWWLRRRRRQRQYNIGLPCTAHTAYIHLFYFIYTYAYAFVIRSLCGSDLMLCLYVRAPPSYECFAAEVFA